MKRLVQILTTVAMSAIALWAQSTTQQLSGTVHDASGAVVTTAKVSVLHVDTGQVRNAVVNESGNWVVPSIPIGLYEVTVEAPGFKRVTQKNVVVAVNAKPDVETTLEVGSVTDSVTVSADSAQVETSSGEVGRLITGQQATNLQLNGRNFTQLLSLIPGVSTTNRSAMDLFGGYGSNMSAQSANGSRTDTFSWNIDGVDNKDNGGGGNNFVNINPDAIAEFKVLTTNYSAEYGQNAGAIINLAMKSGTKDFHGGMYEFVRNDAFDARAFNAITKQKLRFNNFGWNLGGPVYIPGKFNSDRSKLFAFGGMEFKRLRQGAINTWVVPTPALRNGDFSGAASSTWPKDPSTGAVFPGGIIPSTRISKNMSRLIQNFPAPNFSGSGGNFVFPTTAPNDATQYFIKGDYILSNKNQISVHFLHDYYTNLNNLTSLVTYTRKIPGTNTKAQWTHIANATTVNTFQASFSGNVILQGDFAANPVFLNDYTRAGQGITLPMIYGTNNTIPTVNIAGYNGLGASNVNWNNFNRLFNFKDDFSKYLGNHNIKAGILIMRSRKNQDNWPAVNGTITYATGHSNSTGNAMGDALLGNFSQYTEANTNREGWYRFTQIEPYVQDDWKVNSRLTVNMGFRYQYMQPQYCALQNCVMWLPQYYSLSKAPQINPANGQILAGNYDPYNGLVLGGTEFPEAAKQRIAQTSDPAVLALFRGIPKETANKYWGTWGPRLGFALDLTGKQKTVVRGGYGVFYERVEGNFIFSAINNPPFISQSDIYDANIENPTGGSRLSYPAAISNSHFPDMKVPRIMNWSFGVQHKIDSMTTLDVAYVGSSAANLARTLNYNQLRAGTLQKNPGVNTNALRPYPGYANINMYVTGSNFIYNSLQTSVKRQMRGGGLLNLAYTWSRAITDASAYNEQPMDSYNFKAERGLATYHRAHVFVFSYIYPLPFWRTGAEWYKKALGGWQVSGVTTLQSGTPLNLSINPDQAGIGQTSQRPDVVGDWNQGARQRLQWFNTAAFALPAAGTFGNLGRNVLIGPGVNNWDASLQKFFRFNESTSLQFRAEFYDAPNHLSWWGVGTTMGASNFGQITSATDPRTMQFGLRFNF
ncbi:MAG: carboxypeptidase regulatory-like domain-containing protein [Acidobacteria bacterium]|nr:carboxypeptidase regulatory-like domain-containing protein [Acidobacteriota bacterium]